MSQMQSMSKEVGQTADAGFQVGVRRTLPLSQEQAWQLLTSAEGLKWWIGTAPNLEIREGETFTSAEGVSGQFRVVKPQLQLRLKWERSDWIKASTLQIRLISAVRGRTTISFHQDRLENPGTREQMKLYWEHVLDVMKEHASIFTNGEGGHSNE
ncbi:SRPBCC domain-containing protein [Paenibacillus sp. GCM10027627]|uniref:SRPBCC domain-containing protein n=1 Tax=unclassified Paenibacillus TaxID=185978 RepID=UPI00363DB078